MSPGRFGKALGETVKPALRTIRFLFSLMIPVSLGVLLLEESGLLAAFARLTAPLMRFLGLPGEAALVFLSSIFLNIYSAVAVIETLNLSGRDIIILASMCLIAHNFFIECAVMKKNGSILYRIVLLRLFCAALAAWVLNRLLPPGAVPAEAGAVPAAGAAGLDLRALPSLLLPRLAGTGLLLLRTALIVFAVVFLQKILDEFGVIKLLGRLTAPLMAVLGLSANSGYVWIVANLIGMVYGAAVLIEEIRSGALSPQEADLFNHHAAVSHSHVEDTLLFMALGVPFLWAALPRFILAIIVVWLERLRRVLFRRSFRVKIMG
jgi:spore maturation protein SpmB